jgi:hypothetical protein
MSHCNPASTVSINLSNVAGVPFSPNGMTRNSESPGLVAKAVLCHPIKQPPRRLPDVLAKEVDKQVKGMLNNEVITPSSRTLVIACRLGEYLEYRSSVENQQLPDK